MTSLNKDINKILENEIIHLNDDNINKLRLNREDLYSFDKKKPLSARTYRKTSRKDNKNWKSAGGIKGNTTTILGSSTRKETEKIVKLINKFSVSSIHIPFTFVDDKRYYIEFTAQMDKKLIIAVCKDFRHKEELIHISCFPKTYIHITFIHDGKHYKLYNLYNPDNEAEYLIDFIKFIIKSKEYLEKSENIPRGEWDSSQNNNWVTIKDDKEIINIFIQKMYILLCAIRYIIANKDILFNRSFLRTT